MAGSANRQLRGPDVSIKTAYNSLLRELAIEKKHSRGVKLGAPSESDYWSAEHRINAMKITDVIEGLIRHDDSDN